MPSMELAVHSTIETPTNKSAGYVVTHLVADMDGLMAELAVPQKDSKRLSAALFLDAPVTVKTGVVEVEYPALKVTFWSVESDPASGVVTMAVTYTSHGTPAMYVCEEGERKRVDVTEVARLAQPLRVRPARARAWDLHDGQGIRVDARPAAFASPPGMTPIDVRNLPSEIATAFVEALRANPLRIVVTDKPDKAPDKA